MVLGHYAVAFIAKAARPQLPWWLLFLAVIWVDVVFIALSLAGVERASLDFGLASNPYIFEYHPYSHSLLAGGFWGVFASAIVWQWAGLRRGAAVLGLAVLSHWFLDFIDYRSQLTLAGPAYGAGLGLGLWNMPLFANGLEFVMLGLCAGWCWRRAPDLHTRKVIVVLALVLAVWQVIFILSQPPPTLNQIALALLGIELAPVALAASIERKIASHRG